MKKKGEAPRVAKVSSYKKNKPKKVRLPIDQLGKSIEKGRKL